MKLRLFLVLALAFSFVACDSLHKKKKAKAVAPQPIKDASGEVSYEAFVGQLRKAVEKHDLQLLASLMTSDFGYLIDPTPADPGSGEGVWAYWEANHLWPELNRVVHERFVPFRDFMVAPSRFVTDPDYTGYRAGIIQVNGSWKFAYFVAGNQEAPQ